MSQFTRKPGQAIEEDQIAHCQQQRAAAHFDRMQVAAKALVEAEKWIDAQRREQKRNCQAGGIEGQKKNAARNRLGRGGHGQHAGQDWPDAGSPAKSEGKAEQKAASNARKGSEARSCWLWPPRLRKWMSRLSQRVSTGPTRKISETEINCAGPNPQISFPPSQIHTAAASASSTPPITRPPRTGMRPSQPMRCRPRSTIIAPAKGASKLRLRTRNWPTALADAPKVMNTTEKPITKANEDVSRLPRGLSPCRSCSTPMPESMEI